MSAARCRGAGRPESHDASSPPFAELSADHVRLHTLTTRLEHAYADPCSPTELREVIDDLLTTLRRHLDDEQAVLAVLAAADSEVPGVAEPSAANDVWRPDDDTPIRIYVDGLPAEHAFELCIERLLRLLPGQTAELHTDDAQLVAAVSRWLRDFDAAQFGLGHATHGTERLVRVARRRVSTPAAIGYPG